jgi:FeS assembly protein IscX
MPAKFTWTDIDDIALALVQHHPGRDPLSVRFTELRDLVRALPDFEEEPGHRVNEQILEAIQAAWIEEHRDQDRGEEDEPGYQPPNPFR